MKIWIFFLTALCFIGNSTARADAATPPGYSISAADLAIQLPNTDWKNERYRVQIFRKFDGAEQEKLLRIAEAVYPARNNILAAGKKMSGTLSAQDQKTKDLWWWNDFDGVRLPYALTTSAVVYYRQKIREFRGGDFKGSNSIEMSRANMKYVASIAPLAKFNLNKREFRDVYVVQMQLIWNQYCGSTCAMVFDRQRTVVLDKNGAVLAVSGDGAESVVVS